MRIVEPVNALASTIPAPAKPSESRKAKWAPNPYSPPERIVSRRTTAKTRRRKLSRIA